MKLQGLTLLFLSSISLAANAETYYGTAVNPRNSACTRNYDCIVASNHWAHVDNKTTNATKTVYVVYQICPEAEQCKTDRYKIVVPPHGDWQDRKNMSTGARYHNMGDRGFTATTTLMELSGKVLKTESKRGRILVNG